MTHLAFKYRIYADKEVDYFFSRICGTVRLVYNVALEQRSNHWRQYRRSEGRNLSYPSQARELTAIRAEYDWVAECPIDAQQQALRDLDQAFRNFLAGRAGYPKPRRKFVNDAFRIPASRVGKIEVLNRKWARVRLPKIGVVKFRYTRPIQGEVGNVTVTREANGWHIVFSCSFEHEVPVNDNPSVGIDRGIVNNVALSTGEIFSMPDSTDLMERHKRWQQTTSRRKPRSRRQAKAKRHVALVAAKAARRRRHWQHVVTTRVARRFSTVVLEDLKIRNMMASAAGTVEEPSTNVAQKRGLNRSIAGASWFQFEKFQTYKFGIHRRLRREDRPKTYIRDLRAVRVEGQGKPRKPSEVPVPILRAFRPRRHQRGGEHP